MFNEGLLLDRILKGDRSAIQGIVGNENLARMGALAKGSHIEAFSADAQAELVEEALRGFEIFASGQEYAARNAQKFTSGRGARAFYKIFQGKTQGDMSNLIQAIIEGRHVPGIDPHLGTTGKDIARVIEEEMIQNRALMEKNKLVSSRNMKAAGVIRGAWFLANLFRPNQIEGDLMSLVDVGHMPGVGGEKYEWRSQPPKYIPPYQIPNRTRLTMYNPAVQDRIEYYNAHYYSTPTKTPVHAISPRRTRMINYGSYH
tara:strand:- start:162 stop:935 length:774 start_codon:yes stop_codon:yes gene_type:complete